MRRAWRGLAAVIVVAGSVVPAGAASAAGSPSPTPDGDGDFVVCTSEGDAPLHCNYGIVTTGDTPDSITFGGQSYPVTITGQGTFTVNAGTALYSIPETFQTCYSSGACLQSQTVGNSSYYPQETFTSGTSGIPDSQRGGLYGGLVDARDTEVGYVEDGVALVIAVVVAGCGAGLLVKYARRGMRSA